MTTVAPGDIQQAFVDAVGAENVTLDVDGYSVDGLAPSLIVRPSDIHQLARAMAVAAERRLAVAPRGGGTRMEVGTPPERLDAVVEVSRLDNVIEHNPADLTVTTQAGITVASLRKVLEKEAQLLAIDPPLPDRATIGGTLASGADGPLRWHYGHPRDSVIGMKVVQADGTITKSGGQVVKNVSGYDMSRLHVGGLGTLGVIAEVSFKLTPLPQRQATLLGGFESVEAALEAGLGIFHSQVMPLALTVFDDTVRRPAGFGAPESSHLLAVRLGGRPRSLRRQVAECAAVCRAHGADGVLEIEGDDATSLWRSLADFGWDQETAPLVVRAGLLPISIRRLMDGLREARAAVPLPAVVAQPGFGVVHMVWYADSLDSQIDQTALTLIKARDAVHRAGGRAVIERCPTDVKSRLDVWDTADAPLAVMRRMKEQYDPLRILNPGRFIGGI